MADERYSEWMEESPKTWAQGLFETSSTQKQVLGTIRKLNDGRKFVYAKAGGVDLAAAKLVQAPAPIANHTNCAVAAAVAIGERSVTLTLGATAVTANQYKDGFLLVNNGTGKGCAYKIKSHPAASGGASLTVTLYDKIRVALDATTSKGSLVSCSQNGVIIHPSPPTAKLVGVPLLAVTAGYYFWAQCGGCAPVLIDGTVTVGKKVVASGSVDGAIALMALTSGTPNTGSDQYPVGVMVQNGVDTEYGIVDLKLD
jgi:hypothetical protein